MRSSAGSIDKIFLWLFSGLMVFGLVMLMSASGPLGYQTNNDSFYYLKHQILVGILPGIAILVAFALVDYRQLKQFAFPSLVASVVLLMLVYVPGIGMRVGGSARWVHFGPLSFQPSEFVKVTFLIYVAAWLSSRQERDSHSVERGLVPFLTALGAVMFLLAKQPNTGSMMVIAGSALIAYFVAGAPLVWFGILGGASVGLVALLIKFTPYRAARFMTFLHPELDPKGIGYHINQAYLAIGSGGIFGLGYGHSRQKFLYLPEVAGDSIFAVMAEELGFIFMLLLIAAFCAIVWRCFVIARRAPDQFGTLLVSGIGGWIALQAFFNIASMIGLMPMTGVTLPFISYGSSALIALCAGCGIVMSVSRQSS